MTPNNFMQFQADAFRAANDMMVKTSESVQQLAALNAEFGKTAFERSAEQMQSLIGANDASAFSKVVSENAKPSAEFATYMKDVAELANTTTAELTAMAEKQIGEVNEKIDESIEVFAKSAPVGSEGAVTAMRQYVATSRAAYDQATSAGKQFTSMVAPIAKAATEKATGTK